MTAARILGFMGWMSLAACAGMRSGKATAEWLSSSMTCEPGEPLQTAIRLTLEDGWHAYWLNPGEAGMKTSVQWHLPAGWSAGEPGYPPPKRFKSGGLSGFGYNGVAVFPVVLTPPAEFRGKTVLKARVRWLACNDDGCVPGDAELELELSAGPQKDTGDAAAVREALGKIPKRMENWADLAVTEHLHTLILTLKPAPGTSPDLSQYEMFPATPDVVAPVAEIHFTPSGNTWTCEVPKNPYAKSPVKRLTLVLVPKKEARESIELTWTVS